MDIKTTAKTPRTTKTQKASEAAVIAGDTETALPAKEAGKAASSVIPKHGRFTLPDGTVGWNG